MLIGRLGKDPEIIYLPNGDPVATFSLATSESWKDKNTGEKQEKTEWHNIVLYRGLAKIAEEYLKKGNQVFISGKMQSRKYMGQDNIERMYYEIIGNELVMPGNKNENNNQQKNTNQNGVNSYTQKEYSPYTTQENNNYSTTIKANLNDLPDNVPF